MRHSSRRVNPTSKKRPSHVDETREGQGYADRRTLTLKGYQNMGKGKPREISIVDVEGAIDTIDFVACSIGTMLGECGMGENVANGALCALTSAADTIREYIQSSEIREES